MDKSIDKSILLTGQACDDPTQEAEFLEAILERFKLHTKHSILDKREHTAKADAKEEVYELHLEIQELERNFREILDVAGLVMRKNRDVSELLNQRRDVKMAQQVSLQKETEIEQLKIRVKEKDSLLEDEKERVQELTQYCKELKINLE